MIFVQEYPCFSFICGGTFVIFVNVGYFPQLVIVHSCETSLRQIYSSFCGTSACVGDDRCGEVTDGPWGVWGGDYTSRGRRLPVGTIRVTLMVYGQTFFLARKQATC